MPRDCCHEVQPHKGKYYLVSPGMSTHFHNAPCVPSVLRWVDRELSSRCCWIIKCWMLQLDVVGFTLLAALCLLSGLCTPIYALVQSLKTPFSRGCLRKRRASVFERAPAKPAIQQHVPLQQWPFPFPADMCCCREVFTTTLVTAFCHHMITCGESESSRAWLRG